MNVRYLATTVSWLALLAWVLWWLGSLADFRLWFAEASWLPVLHHLGYDFMHSYLGTQAWLQGGNPYLQDFGDERGRFGYLPFVLPLFSWVGLTPDLRVATSLWTLFIASACAIAVWQISRLRKTLAWSGLAVPVMLALVLWSAPVVFAMERGSTDALVLVCALGAAALLGRAPRWQVELPAGFLLALAVGIKVYPVVAVVALLALRRFAVLAFMVMSMAALALWQAEGLQQWMAHAHATQESRVGPVVDFLRWLRGDLALGTVKDMGHYYGVEYWGSLHSPGDWWPALWLRLGVVSPTAWPLLAVHFLVLAPVTLWGAWRILLARNTARLSLPILLWVMALASYWMPLSYDYNLIFLPLLVVASWDSREPRWMLVLLLAFLPWWLPFGPLAYDWSLARVLLKLFALHVATLLLVRSLTRDFQPAVAAEECDFRHAPRG